MKKLAVALAFLLSACASGPHFSEAPAPESNESLVYLFRGHGHSIMNVTYTFEDTKVVSLGNEEYSWITVKPGQYRIAAAEPISKSLAMSLNVKEGEVYYIGYNIERNTRGAMITLRPYSAEEAAWILEESEHKEVARLPEAAR